LSSKESAPRFGRRTVSERRAESDEAHDQFHAPRSRGALDLKLIARSVADLRKRARRLRDNMMLPETENVFERPPMEVGPEVGATEILALSA
jgi:hypothetical protein